MKKKREIIEDAPGDLLLKCFVLIGCPFLIFITFWVFGSKNAELPQENEKAPTHQETETISVSDANSELTVDDYEGDADYDLAVKDYYVGFTNLYVVYDLLTLEAISNLPDDVAEFLNAHGYGYIHTLAVIEDSIVFDKAYPYFICSMEGIDNSFVEIRYDISKNKFEFSIVNAD